MVIIQFHARPVLPVPIAKQPRDLVLQDRIASAQSGAVIEIAPGEYQGPLILDKPVTLVGKGRSTVIWSGIGPTILVFCAGVKLVNLLLETTLLEAVPTVLFLGDTEPHLEQIYPTLLGSQRMNKQHLIDLGDLIPGKKVTLTFEVPQSQKINAIDFAQPSKLLHILPAADRNRHNHRRFRLQIDVPNEEGILLEQIVFRDQTTPDQPQYYLVKGIIRKPSKSMIHTALMVRKGDRDDRIIYFDGGFELGFEQIYFLSGGAVKQKTPARRGVIVPAADDESRLKALWLPSAEDSGITLSDEKLTPWTRRLLLPDQIIVLDQLQLWVKEVKSDAGRLNFPSMLLDFGRIQNPTSGVVQLNVTCRTGKLFAGRDKWVGKIQTLVDWLERIDQVIEIAPGKSLTIPVRLNETAFRQKENSEQFEPSAVVIYSSSSENEMYFLGSHVVIDQQQYALQFSSNAVVFTSTFAYPLYAGELEGKQTEITVSNVGRDALTCEFNLTTAWLDTPVKQLTLSAGEQKVIDFRMTTAANTLPAGKLLEAAAVRVRCVENGIELTLDVQIDQVGAERKANIVIMRQSGFTSTVKINLDDPVSPHIRFRIVNKGTIEGEYTCDAVGQNLEIQLKPKHGSLAPNQEAAIELHIDARSVLNQSAGSQIPITFRLQAGKTNAQQPATEERINVEIIDEYPLLELTKKHHVLDELIEGNTLTFRQPITIQNRGKGPFSGNIISHVSWLTVAEGGAIRILPGEQFVCHVNTTPAISQLAPGVYNEVCAIEVQRGGNRPVLRQPACVGFELTVVSSAPVIYMLKSFLWYGAIQYDVKAEQLPVDNITIGNMGYSEWSGEIVDIAPWLNVPFRRLIVPANSLLKIPVQPNSTLFSMDYGVIQTSNALVIQELITGALLPPVTARAYRVQPQSDVSAHIYNLDLGVMMEGNASTLERVIELTNTGARDWQIQSIDQPTWLVVTPLSTTVAAGAEPMLVRLRAETGIELNAKIYQADVRFHGDDGKTITVRVKMEVAGIRVRVEPKELYVTSASMSDISVPSSMTSGKMTNIVKIVNESLGSLPLVIVLGDHQSERADAIKLFLRSNYSAEWIKPKPSVIRMQSSTSEVILEPREEAQLRISIKANRTVTGRVLPSIMVQLPDGQREVIEIRKR